MLFFSTFVFHKSIDIVQEVLTQQAADSTSKLLDNITVISNDIKWDNEGNMEGIKGESILHSSNKGAFAASLNYKDTVKVQAIELFIFLLELKLANLNDYRPKLKVNIVK